MLKLITFATFQHCVLMFKVYFKSVVVIRSSQERWGLTKSGWKIFWQTLSHYCARMACSLPRNWKCRDFWASLQMTMMSLLCISMRSLKILVVAPHGEKVSQKPQTELLAKGRQWTWLTLITDLCLGQVRVPGRDTLRVKAQLTSHIPVPTYKTMLHCLVPKSRQRSKRMRACPVVNLSWLVPQAWMTGVPCMKHTQTFPSVIFSLALPSLIQSQVFLWTVVDPLQRSMQQREASQMLRIVRIVCLGQHHGTIPWVGFRQRTNKRVWTWRWGLKLEVWHGTPQLYLLAQMSRWVSLHILHYCYLHTARLQLGITWGKLCLSDWDVVHQQVNMFLTTS